MSALPVIEPPTLDVPTCCSPPAGPAEDVTTRFHFSLNVSDLNGSVAFYEKLFGVAPAKHFDDYAKFELEQPPLVFALVPNAPESQGALSHMGFPVSSREEVEAVARRLEQAGLPVCAQDGTVCGYARQDKIWVSDPDHNFWEVYVVYEDVDPATINAGFDGAQRRGANAERVATRTEAVQIWEHRVTEGPIRRIPHADAELDEARLTGTFNAALGSDERAHILQEARRALKTGGRISVHGLVASVTIGGALPLLPGVAALVKRVPTAEEIVAELTAAGFTGARITKLPVKPAFSCGGVDMHEIKVQARRLGESNGDAPTRKVLYKGPFARIASDDGTVYERGVRTPVSESQWTSLAEGPAAASFVFLSDAAAGCGCGN